MKTVKKSMFIYFNSSSFRVILQQSKNSNVIWRGMKIFMQITQNSIYDEFPWVRPVDLDFDSEEGFFCDITSWSFNQAQLNSIHLMLKEVENWYLLRNKPIEIVIIDFKEVQGHVFVEKICGFPEVGDIFEKYRAIYLGE
jgi:hypothetical protein